LSGRFELVEKVAVGPIGGPKRGLKKSRNDAPDTRAEVATCHEEVFNGLVRSSGLGGITL
jgi:hypothetical protein